MASGIRMRSYSRKNKNTSLDVVNALFAKNISKRKQTRTRGKVNIQDLPPPDPNIQLSDNSFKIEINNTFDKLKDGSVYKPVTLKNNSVNNFSSESDKSKSQCKLPQISFSHKFHSPIIKRKKRKRLGSTAKMKPLLSEIVKQKEDTFDRPIVSSLEITVDKPAACNLEKTTLSIKYNISEDSSKITEVITADVSYEPIFSNTFRERVLGVPKICSTPNVSSTPQLPLKRHEIASEISPIPAKKRELLSPHVVLEQSYKEIEKWNSKFPIECSPVPGKCSTPKPKASLFKSGKNMITRKHLLCDISEIVKNDKKLQLEPYIKLNTSLKTLGIESTVALKSPDASKNNNIEQQFFNADSVESFSGFTTGDLDYAAKKSCSVNKSVKSQLYKEFENIRQPYVNITRLTDKLLQNYRGRSRSLPPLSVQSDYKLHRKPVVWLSRLSLPDSSKVPEKKLAKKETSDFSCVMLEDESTKSTNYSKSYSRNFSGKSRFTVASDNSKDIMQESTKSLELYRRR